MAAKRSNIRGLAAVFDDQRINSDRYYVPKGSGTFADVLLAYGFAAVIHEILRQAKDPTARVSVKLEDTGSWYKVILNEPLRREWIERCRYFSVAKGVRTGKAKIGSMAESELEDYEGAWQEIRDYLAARQSRRDAGAEAAASEAEMAAADVGSIDPRHWLTVLIGTRQMQALSTYNDAARQWWETREYFAANLKTLLALFAGPGVDKESVVGAWKRAVPIEVKLELTASQMLNPHCGKGQNRPKANALAMENVRSFWLVEYLKAAGLWRCAAPRRVRSGDDRKTYVLTPVSLSLAAHERIFKVFSERLWAETSVKMDCLAALLYTETLLEHSEAGQYDELAALFGEKSVRDMVAGFHVAQYKLLSRNAYTMINLGFLGLPRWIGLVHTRGEVRHQGSTGGTPPCP